MSQPIDASKPHSVRLGDTLIDAAQLMHATLLGEDALAHSDEEGGGGLTPAVTHWLYETWREFGWVHARLYALLARPPSPDFVGEPNHSPLPPLIHNRAVEALLMIALVMLVKQRYSVPTLINEAVYAAERLAGEHHKGLVNAVLRRAAQEAGDTHQDAALIAPTFPLEAPEDSNPQLPISNAEAQFHHPRWWANKLYFQWGKNPELCVRLMQSTLRHPPLTLRANPLWGSVDEALAELKKSDRASTRIGQSPDDWQIWQGDTEKKINDLPDFWQSIFSSLSPLMLDKPCAVSSLPDFARGRFSVHDAASQLAVAALDINREVAQSGRILDACAAPGGKSGQIAEIVAHHLAIKPHTPSADTTPIPLIALEKNRIRAQKIFETRARLGLNFAVCIGDIGQPNAWWDKVPFARIMLDAPCSAVGSVRRHPDTLWRLAESDIQRLANEQKNWLIRALSMLAPNGRLVYSTCSIFAEENFRVVSVAIKILYPHLTQAQITALIPHLTTIPNARHDGHFIAIIEPSRFSALEANHNHGTTPQD